MAASGDTTCARCGAAMTCRPEGDCWCMAQPPRLPVPTVKDGPAACLCPRCLAETPIAAGTAEPPR